MAMGQNLWLHFEVDEHPFATYFGVRQGYRVLTHSHINQPTKFIARGCFFFVGNHLEGNTQFPITGNKLGLTD